MKKTLTAISFIAILIFACSKEDEPVIIEETTPAVSGPNLIFKFHFDSTLARLDNFGNPAAMPAGNAGQHPQFKLLAAHSIEFAPDSLTQLGLGEMVFMSAETSAGGSPATDFNQVPKVADGDIFYSTPIANITPNTYEWARVAVTYQNYDITYLAQGFFYTGRVASFVDDFTYITNYNINTQNIVINGNKAQGYWGFETTVLGNPLIFEGQAPGTTVPNPIATTSPIPTNSCVVTGKFPTNLTITGNETSDIVVTFNLSTNNSFEWKDLNGDGFYEPSDGVNPGDTVVDMGLRGLFPTFQ